MCGKRKRLCVPRGLKQKMKERKAKGALACMHMAMAERWQM